MFQISPNEFEDLKSQIVTSSWGGLRRALPYAFTEQGVAMLSSVLRSKRAVEVNIAIMRTFVQLRRFMDTNRDLARKIEALEKKYDEQFTVVFEAIKQLIATPRRAAQTNWLSSIALPSVAELLSAEDCLLNLGLITDHEPTITGLP